MTIQRRHFGAALAALAPAVWAPQVQAQFRVEISGVGATQLPIAIPRFRDEDRSGQQLSAIVRADLERSGAFRIVESSGALDERSQPQWADWRGRGADALSAAGSTAQYVCFERQIHGFITMGRLLDEANTAVGLCGVALRRALG